MKQSGHRRVSPSDHPDNTSKQNMLKCSWKNCGKILELQGLLGAHMEEHRLVNLNHCAKCDESFRTKADLREHILSEHEENEWNCLDCSFQANSSGELIKHLRLLGHQPCKEIQDPKSKIIVCYTCKEEFSSKWNLMNHRKQKHPSNKICRYFLKNECIHGVNCWYRHDEKMEIDFPFESLKDKRTSCSKANETEKAQRTHIEKEHVVTANNQNSFFQKDQVHTFPPDQNIMQTLQMVLQRMNIMEAKLQNIQ